MSLPPAPLVCLSTVSDQGWVPHRLPPAPQTLMILCALAARSRATALREEAPVKLERRRGRGTNVSPTATAAVAAAARASPLQGFTPAALARRRRGPGAGRALAPLESRDHGKAIKSPGGASRASASPALRERAAGRRHVVARQVATARGTEVPLRSQLLPQECGAPRRVLASARPRSARVCLCLFPRMLCLCVFVRVCLCVPAHGCMLTCMPQQGMVDD